MGGNVQSSLKDSTLSYIPTNASEWTLKDLLVLGISYNSSPTVLSEFMPMLIRKSDNKQLSTIDLTGGHKFMSTQTPEWWKFSFEFDERVFKTDKEKTDNLKTGKEETIESLKKLKEERIQIYSNEGISLDTLYRWKLSLEDFFTFLLDLLDRWDTESQRKGRFTHLFMLFLRTCLLRPEPGVTYHETLNIKRSKVGGDPDARLKVHRSQKTLAVIEVKTEDAFTKNQSYKTLPICEQTQSALLGQHGIELLLQMKNSCFQSGVAGLVCIGTKVIFTFLNITPCHLHHIEDKDEAGEEDKATIFYTTPFDFMKVEDRNEMLEILLKLAVMQSENLS